MLSGETVINIYVLSGLLSSYQEVALVRCFRLQRLWNDFVSTTRKEVWNHPESFLVEQDVLGDT